MTALLKEMEWQKHYIGPDTVETIYLGGGTPSLLTEDELQRILDRLQNLFTISPDAEITLEANPDDITTTSKPAAWRRAGINRLSIGIQSFFEEDLQWMNRAHTAGQALTSIKIAQDQGLDNISADLIYGTPTLPDIRWESNVLQAIQLDIPHLSCYALTVEPKTALDKMIHQHKKEPVNPDDQARQFILLMDWLSDAGYDHYEISNFARPGKRSRHNSSYWQGKPYLGLGPSAHSYNGNNQRQWNVTNNAQYIDRLLAPAAPPPGSDAGMPASLFEKEELTPVQQLNEYIMISLRTMEGCDLWQVSQRFGADAASVLYHNATGYIRDGKLTATGHTAPDIQLILTREGKLLADGIASDLFFE